MAKTEPGPSPLETAIVMAMIVLGNQTVKTAYECGLRDGINLCANHITRRVEPVKEATRGED